MTKTVLTLFFTTLTIFAQTFPENATCKQCHPKIFKEYQSSMHKNASIYNDPVHNAVWQMHPAKRKNNYKCAKCHSPADHKLLNKETKLHKNRTQLNEPISCQTCHKIKSIKYSKKSNQNIYTQKEKTFFAADKNRKGEKLTFKEDKRFLGLFKSTKGSPYHDLDYSNEIFYTGDICLGCHEKKQNAHGFSVCDMEIKKDPSSKHTCISCHMPKVKGSYVNQKKSKTHAYHGISALTDNPKNLGKYIKLSLEKEDDEFKVYIKNEASHTLTPHPLREARLRVFVIRDANTTKLEEKSFLKVIGTNSKPSMPWLATEIIKDTSIKAFEKREVTYKYKLQENDIVVLKFGYFLVREKAAKMLGLKDEKYTKFILLTKMRVKITNTF